MVQQQTPVHADHTHTGHVPAAQTNAGHAQAGHDDASHFQIGYTQAVNDNFEYIDSKGNCGSERLINHNHFGRTITNFIILDTSIISLFSKILLTCPDYS